MVRRRASTIVSAYQNRGLTKDFTFQNTSGRVTVPGSSDLIRVLIGRIATINTAPLLTVLSGSDTAAGSSFTKNTPERGVHRLRLDATDLDFAPGTYSLLVDYFDAADASEWKTVSRHIFVLFAT